MFHGSLPLAAVILCLLSSLHPSHCYPSGAPDKSHVCKTLEPSADHHPAPEDLGAAPFELLIISHTSGKSVFDLQAGWFKYKSMTEDETTPTVNVQLQRTDGQSFRGFLIQARDVQTQEPLGSFDISDSLYAQEACSSYGGGSVTHTNRIPKFSVIVPWSPPVDFTGEVQFYATAVEKNDDTGSVYWTGITSKPFTINMNPEEPEVVLFDNVNTTVNLTACGKTISCFKYPQHCQTLQECHMLVAWRKVDNTVIDFKMYAKVGSENQWMALGLSHDKWMGDDSVTECVYNSGAINVYSSWNENLPRDNSPLHDRELGLKSEKSVGVYENGALQCNFTRYMTVTNASHEEDMKKVYDLDSKEYYLLVAMGSIKSDATKNKHVQQPLVSPIKVDLSSSSYIIVEKAPRLKLPYIKAHGCLMIFAWVMFASVGILLSRYFQNAWPSRDMCGKSLWSLLHISFMLTALVFTIIAVIVNFIQAQGYSSGNRPAHGIVGLIVLSLVVINPIVALFRPPPNSKKRPVINMIHFSIGRLAHILAVLNAMLGLRQGLVAAERWTLWVMVMFINVHVITEVILSLEKFKFKRTSKYLTKTNQEAASRYSPKAALFRTIVLAVYSVIVLAVTICLVVHIATRTAGGDDIEPI